MVDKQFLHFGNGVPEPHEDRPTHDGMPDVQFPNPEQGGDGPHVAIVQGMTGIEAHASGLDELPCFGHPGMRLGGGRISKIPTRGMEGMGVWAGMHLADLDADLGSGFDLCLLGIDECARPNACLGQLLDDSGKPASVSSHVEAALGGDLEATLRYQHRHLGLQGTGDLDHLGARGHLQVQWKAFDLGERPDIVVLDVASILAEVNRDSIRPPEQGFLGCQDRIGLVGPTCLTNRRDMIDVDTEFNHGVQGSSTTTR